MIVAGWKYEPEWCPIINIIFIVLSKTAIIFLLMNINIYPSHWLSRNNSCIRNKCWVFRRLDEWLNIFIRMIICEIFASFSCSMLSVQFCLESHRWVAEIFAALADFHRKPCEHFCNLNSLQNWTFIRLSRDFNKSLVSRPSFLDFSRIIQPEIPSRIMLGFNW